MKNLVKIRAVALFATLCINHVYALDGSTWKVINITNDLGHEVKISQFEQKRGTFVLANIPGDKPENNNWNITELNKSTEIIIPAFSSLNINNKSVTFKVMQGGEDRTNDYKNASGGARAALVFIAHADLYDSTYGTMLLSPNTEIGQNSVYLGYNAWTQGQNGFDYMYYIYPLYVNDVMQSSMGLKAETPSFGSFRNINEIFFGGSDHGLDPAVGTFSVAENICANQTTIANYLNCFNDRK
jgi:hypothetical protein